MGIICLRDTLKALRGVGEAAPLGAAFRVLDLLHESLCACWACPSEIMLYALQSVSKGDINSCTWLIGINQSVIQPL